MPTGMDDYRSELRAELTLRARANTRYSLRALARDLDVSPAFLSQVLNAKRSLSEERAWDWAERLKWSKRRQTDFVAKVRLETIKDPALKLRVGRTLPKAAPKPVRPRKVSQDVLDAFSSWEHFAILELVGQASPTPPIEKLAARLAITGLQAQLAVDRLLRLGLLVMSEHGLSKPREDNQYATGHDIPSQAVRKLHLQALKKAAQALESQAVGEREFCTLYTSGDPARIQEFKKLLRDFQFETWAAMEATAPRAVYQLTVQLIRVDRPA